MSNPGKTTIVFTDSGLGGISIMAEFYNLLKETQNDLQGNDIEIVFFNALKEYGYGYNTMEKMDEKVSTFNAALEMISEFYNPRIIAIACNTLSAIYPNTPFAETAQNSYEIISGGRSQIADFKNKNPDIPIIILATKTTIDSGAYDFNDPQIIPVSGGFLAQYIEFDSTSTKIIKALNVIFKEIESLVSGNKIALFLGCTHYGYISDLLRETAENFSFSIVEILNPNTAFAHFLFDTVKNIFTSSKGKSEINLRIESQAFIDPSEITSISNLVKIQSPEITKILQNYTRLEKRF